MLALSKSMFGQSFRFSEVSSALVAWRIKRMSMSDVVVILKKVKGKKWLHQVDIGYGEYYYPTIGDPYINMDRQKGQMCSSLSSTSSDPGIFYFLLPNSINISVSPLELSIVRFVRNRFNCWFCDLPSQVALLFFPLMSTVYMWVVSLYYGSYWNLNMCCSCLCKCNELISVKLE